MTASIEDWARLCTLLDDDPELEPSIRGAVDDGGSPWAALIDGLDEAGALAYLEKTDTGIELSDALPALPRVFRAGIDLDEVGDVDGDLSTAIMRADEILAPHGLRLVHLRDEEDEDAYPLVAVPASNVDEILAIVAKLGYIAR